MGFSKQEYCSGLPFPSPGDLPDPGIKLGSPALQADFFLPSEPPGKPSRPEENLQFRVCNNDKPRANSHIAVGECFHREEKEVGRTIINRVHGFLLAESFS